MTKQFPEYEARDFLRELTLVSNGGQFLLPVWGGLKNSTIVGYKVLDDDAIVLKRESFRTIYYSFQSIVPTNSRGFHRA